MKKIIAILLAAVLVLAAARRNAPGMAVLANRHRLAVVGAGAAGAPDR